MDGCNKRLFLGQKDVSQLNLKKKYKSINENLFSYFLCVGCKKQNFLWNSHQKPCYNKFNNKKGQHGKKFLFSNWNKISVQSIIDSLILWLMQWSIASISHIIYLKINYTDTLKLYAHRAIIMKLPIVGHLKS